MLAHVQEHVLTPPGIPSHPGNYMIELSCALHVASSTPNSHYVNLVSMNIDLVHDHCSDDLDGVKAMD